MTSLTRDNIPSAKPNLLSKDDKKETVIGQFNSFFDKSISFQNKYQRNNKKGGRKHLRCFPCCATKHTINAACAIPVPIKCLTTIDNADDCSSLIALARFVSNEKEPSFPAGDIHIGDIVPTDLLKNSIRSSAEPLNPIYVAKALETKILPSENVCETNFVFKESCWHYGWTGGRYRSDIEHQLRIYIFRPLDRLPVYDFANVHHSHKIECVSIVQSSPFTIFSSRSAPPAYTRASDPETTVNTGSPSSHEHENLQIEGNQSPSKKRMVDECGFIDISRLSQSYPSCLPSTKETYSSQRSPKHQKTILTTKNSLHTPTQEKSRNVPTRIRGESSSSFSGSSYPNQNTPNNFGACAKIPEHTPLPNAHPMFSAANNNVNPNLNSIQFRPPLTPQIYYNSMNLNRFELPPGQNSNQYQRDHDRNLGPLYPHHQQGAYNLPLIQQVQNIQQINTYYPSSLPWNNGGFNRYISSHEERKLGIPSSFAGGSLNES